MFGFRAVLGRLVSAVHLALAIATAVAAWSGPASAQPYPNFTLTAPAQGSTVAAQSNVLIQWIDGDPAWTVDLTLQRVNPWGFAAAVVSGIPNSGSFSWTFPASLSCDDDYLFQIMHTNTTSWNEWNWGPAFTLACGDSGTVAVAKTVTNNTPGDLTGWQYPVTVACAGMPDATPNLSEGAPPIPVSGAPLGTPCMVTEVLPLPIPVAPKGRRLCPEGMTAQWLLPTYSPAQNTTASSQPVPVTVHNTLTCVDPNSAVVAVVKTVTNNTPADLTGWRYPATVTCGGVVVSTLQLAEFGPQYVSGAGVALGAPCTIAEILPLPLPVAPKGRRLCPEGMTAQWLLPTYSPGQTIIAAIQPDMVTINNVLTCVKEGGGTLTVIKKVTNNTGADLEGWRYPITVYCDGRPEVVLSLTDGGFDTVTGVAPGVDCKVVEDTPHLPERACPEGMVPQWTVIAPNDYVHAGGTATIENVLDCVKAEKPAGTIVVTKQVTNNTAAVLPPDQQYVVNVYCDGSPDASFGLADQQSGVVNNVPLAADCKVVEDTPQLPPSMTEGACPPGMVPQWTTTSSPAGYVHAGDQVTVQNVLDCVEEVPLGSLTVRKIVDNPTSIDISTVQFDVQVDCGGTVTTFQLLNGGSDTVSNIANGTNCTVAETPPLPVGLVIGNECFVAGMVPVWSPPVGYFPGSSVQINGQSATVFVLNSLICGPGPGGTGGELGSLTIQKTIINDIVNITGQPMGDFEVQVSCVNPSSVQTVTLTHANNYQAPVPNPTIGAVCTITEVLPQNPNVLPAGSQWVATYPAGQQVTIQAGNQTLALTNEWVHNAVPPGMSDLRVTKDFAIHGKLDPNHTMTFTVELSCNGSPLTLTLTPNFTGYMDGSVPEATYTAWTNVSVPVGSTCTISEPVLPPLSTDLATCQWAVGGPVYSHFDYGGSEQPGASVTPSVAQQTYELSVLNELNCPPFIVAPEPAPTLKERVCPKGTKLVDDTCVKVKPKPAPVEKPLSCKKGLVLVDGACVKPAKTCKAPFVSNGKGGCVCGPGLKATENGCAAPLKLPDLTLPEIGLKLQF